MKSKVVVGISGGVDSAAALISLLDNGFDVIGCYVRMLDSCGSDSERAAELCDSLSVPFVTVDSRGVFRKYVTDEFCRLYCSGMTPNPCILCNPAVKFRSLSDTADSLNAEHIATGHYARVVICENGIYCVEISDNVKKDQSYMLYALPQEILKKLILPIGCNSKEQNRIIVKNRGLSVFSEKDSQDICFVPDGDYIGFIHSEGFCGPSGNVLSPEGTVLRKHEGIEYFTIGQRKGIADNYPGPLYVKEISADGNVLTSFSDGLFSSSALIDSLKLNPLFDSVCDGPLEAKVRYSSGMTECSIVQRDNDSLILRFNKPVRAVTPGQSAVIYSGSRIVAGGIIKKAF